MLSWTVVFTASVLSLLTKLAGYWVPQQWLQGPRVVRLMRYLPVAVLVAVQTFTGAGGMLALDARAAALIVAAIALMLRAPFLLVIVLAAATAAGLRAAGVM